MFINKYLDFLNDFSKTYVSKNIGGFNLKFVRKVFELEPVINSCL